MAAETTPLSREGKESANKKRRKMPALKQKLNAEKVAQKKKKRKTKSESRTTWKRSGV